MVGIGACAFFLFCYQLSDINDVTLATTGALLSAALAGACAGFLPHNFNPARLFMGDSGSMLIGLVLSASALTLTGQFDGTEVTIGRDGTAAGWVVMFPLLLPVSLLLVPMADLVLAVVRRTRAGRSPFAPDKQHLHHRLLEIGHSQRRAVFIMWTWAALLGFGGVVATLYSGSGGLGGAPGAPPCSRSGLDLPAAQRPRGCAGAGRRGRSRAGRLGAGRSVRTMWCRRAGRRTVPHPRASRRRTPYLPTAPCPTSPEPGASGAGASMERRPAPVPQISAARSPCDSFHERSDLVRTPF